MAWVVEKPARGQDGAQVGTFRIYVASEERAKALMSEGASYRPIADEDMPPRARENMRRA